MQDDLLAWAAAAKATPDQVTLLYLRPSLLMLKDALLGLPLRPSPAASFSTRLLLHIDAELCNHDWIESEQIFHRPETLSRLLGEKFGVQIDATESLEDSSGENERSATAAMLQRVMSSEATTLAGWHGALSGRVYPTAKGQLGRLFLGRGWSWAEETFTWTADDVATITLHFDPRMVETSTAGLRLRIVGAAPFRPLGLQVSHGRDMLAELHLTEEDAAEIVLDLPLPPAMFAEGGVAGELRLTVDRTYCPSELGLNADRRRLALALHSLHVWQHTYSPALERLRTFIAEQRPLAVLSLGSSTAEDDRDLVDLVGTSCMAGALHMPSEIGSAHLPPRSSLVISRHVNPMAVLERDQKIDLIVIWNPTELAATLRALHRRCMGQAGVLPDIAIRADDADVFNAAWWSDPTAFDAVTPLFRSSVEPDWIYMRATRP